MNNETYYIERTCKACKNTERINLTREEAAFDLYDTNKASSEPCATCGTTGQIQISITTPKLDEVLLDSWGNNADYQFWEQDEDLMLATLEETELYLNALDSKNYLKEKRITLLNSLLVIFYDANKNQLSELESKLFEELKLRKELLRESESELYDYVVADTFPLLGLK